MDKDFVGGPPEKNKLSFDTTFTDLKLKPNNNKDNDKDKDDNDNDDNDNVQEEDTTMIHPSTMMMSNLSNASPTNATTDTTDVSFGGSTNKTAGGADPNHFPTHLYKMLEEIDNCQGHAAEKVPMVAAGEGQGEGESGKTFSSIVSWQPHGKCFLIHDEDVFSKYVLPKYFCRLKFTSFQRQLHFHGFKRLCKQGPDKGAYYHDLFARGMPEVATYIQRIKSSKGLRGRKRKSQDQEPDFYKQQSSSSPTIPAMIAAAAANKAISSGSSPVPGPAAPMSPPSQVPMPTTTGSVTTNQAPLPSLVGDDFTADMVRLEPTPIGQMRTVLQEGAGQIPLYGDFQESMNRMPTSSAAATTTTSTSRSAQLSPNKRQRVQHQQQCDSSSSAFTSISAASDNNESKFRNSANNRLDMAAVQMILQQQQQQQRGGGRGGGSTNSLRDASSASSLGGRLQQHQQDLLMPHGMNTSVRSSSGVRSNDHDDTLFQLGMFCNNNMERGPGSTHSTNPTSHSGQQQQPMPPTASMSSLSHLSLDLELEPAPIRFPQGQQPQQQEESTLHLQQQQQQEQYDAEDQLQQHILRQIDEQQRQLRQQRENILQRQQLQLQQRQMNAVFQERQPFGSTTNESGRRDQNRQQQQQQPQRLLQQQPLGFDDQLLPFPGFNQQQQEDERLGRRLGDNNSRHPNSGGSSPHQSQMQRFQKHSS